MQSLSRIVHSQQTKNNTKENDKNIISHNHDTHCMSSQCQMKNAGPNKAQKATSETTNETHQYSEMWNDDSENNGNHNNSHSKS